MWIGYIQMCIFRSFTQSCRSSYLPRKWGKKLIHALAMCIFLWFPSLNPSDSLALQEWSKDAVAKRCGDLSMSHQMSPKPVGKMGRSMKLVMGGKSWSTIGYRIIWEFGASTKIATNSFKRKCPMAQAFFRGWDPVFFPPDVQLAGAGMGLLLGIQQAILWVQP